MGVPDTAAVVPAPAAPAVAVTAGSTAARQALDVNSAGCDAEAAAETAEEARDSGKFAVELRGTLQERVKSDPNDVIARGMLYLLELMTQFRGELIAATEGVLGPVFAREDKGKILTVTRDLVREEFTAEAAKAKFGDTDDTASARYAAYAVFGELSEPPVSTEKFAAMLVRDGDYGVEAEPTTPLTFDTLVVLTTTATPETTIMAFATGEGTEIKYLKGGIVWRADIKGLGPDLKMKSILKKNTTSTSDLK